MTTPNPAGPGRRPGSRMMLWLPGFAVAVGAAVATAHGLYEVALAARVPTVIAWLYPLITDGLALVAYAATARLSGSAARYAWSVVIVSAGLSGLAQAVYLASDTVATGGGLAVSPALRFGVGAWPAVAAAVVAHLLYLLAETRTGEPDAAGNRGRARAEITVPPSQKVRVERPDRVGHLDTVGHGPGVPPALDGPVIPGPPRPLSHPPPRPAIRPDRSDGSTAGGTGGSGVGAQERARSTARTYRERHGRWPTVRELQDAAAVGRGTAARALQQLREDPTQAASGLHLVPDEPPNRTHQ
ncbi:hypothetical protein [Pseudonocardia sp. NPDC049635]|uniref:hypothetical protein n=1 Tax=Pseudonocardia sp. NPDC049635 TaxID=3155506 RepID=UPI0033E95D04